MTDHRKSGSSQRSSRWTVVRRAQGSGAEAQQALRELVERYHHFILRMIRYFRHPPNLTAEDSAHLFVIWLMDGGLSKFDRNLGSFRPWLTERIRRFLRNAWAKWTTEAKTCAADFDVVVDDDAERFCEAAFAWELLLVVLQRLRREDTDPKRFDVLVRFLPGPQVDLVPYAVAAKELGIKPTHFGKLVCELRAKLKRALEDELGDLMDPGPEPDSAPPRPPNTPSAPNAVVRLELRQLRQSLCETPSVAIVVVGP